MISIFQSCHLWNQNINTKVSISLHLPRNNILLSDNLRSTLHCFWSSRWNQWLCQKSFTALPWSSDYAHTQYSIVKNAMNYFEQILETTPHKTTAILWPLASYPSKTNKTRRALLKKQGQTREWHSSMDPNTWICQCWPISKNYCPHRADLFTSALCGHRM